MEEKFKIEIEIDGKIVKADCIVRLGRFLCLTMTAPYRGIKVEIVARDEDGDIRQYCDCQEAKEYACRELESIMAYIKQVRQSPKKYAEVSRLFKERYSTAVSEFRATEAGRQRGWLAIQSKITQQVIDEYTEMVYRLIPTVNKQQIISLYLLEQILRAI